MTRQPKGNTHSKHAAYRSNVVTALIAIAIVAGGVWWGWQYFAENPAVSYAEPAAINAGAKLFAANCATCHGPEAVGESAQNVMGGEKPGGGYWAPALNGRAHAWHHSPDVLFATIKDGSRAADSTMEGWDDRLSDVEIHQIIAYVVSLWPEMIRQRYRQVYDK